MMALPFSGGSATGLSATDAWRRAAVGDGGQRRQGVNCSSLGTCCNRRRARSIISRDLVISSPSVFIRSSQRLKAPSARLSAPTSDANESFDQGEHAYFRRMLFWGAYYRQRP